MEIDFYNLWHHFNIVYTPAKYRCMYCLCIYHASNNIKTNAYLCSTKTNGLRYILWIDYKRQMANNTYTVILKSSSSFAITLSPNI